MENQHRMIKGYRELSQEEIDLINALKREGERLAELVEYVKNIPHVDQRWAAIGKTDLQTGMMALIRAVASPEGF